MSEKEDEALVWMVRLADERPGRVSAVFAVAGLTFLVGTFLFRQPLLGILGAAMLLGATSEYWLGSRFRLDTKGASSRTGPSVTAMEWNEVKRIIERGREVRLSPLATPSFAENTRGVGLLTTPENHEEVLRFVRSRLEKAPLVEGADDDEKAAPGEGADE